MTMAIAEPNTPDDGTQEVAHARVMAERYRLEFIDMNEFRIDDPDGNRLWIGQNTSTPA